MSILNDKKLIQKIDSQDIYHKIIHLPEQIMQAYNHPEISFGDADKDSFGKVSNLILCGMGGSAIAADIAAAAFRTKLPIRVVKEYEIPWLDERSLVVLISYSGNTEEILSCYQQAVKITSHIAVISSGGSLTEKAEGKYMCVKLPAGYPPRTAIGFLFFSLMKILENYGILPDHQKAVNKLIANLIKKAGPISIDTPLAENLAKLGAVEVYEKIPIIYSIDHNLYPIAYRWKCQINENAKYPAFCNYLPEMNHNEIEGWEDQRFSSEMLPIIIRHFQDDDRYLRRINTMKKLFKRMDIVFLEYFVEGDTQIEEIFSLIYLGDMISYYLAILNGRDPAAINFIDYLKQNI